MNTLEAELSQIPQFQYVHEHLFTSGQPDAEQLRLIKEYGINTVINLALTDASPHLQQEDRICLEMDLEYIHIPILWETPSSDQCLLILDLIHHLVQEKMVWLHCAKNYRCSCLIYLYRQYYMDISMPEAQEAMHQIWEPNETWTGLIHAVALQLQGRKATADIQSSMQQG